MSTERTVALDILSRVRVASPCPVSWEEMDAVGDGRRVRHCGQCNLRVYNFSNMEPAEAAALVQAKEGRLCAGFFQRSDGTMIVEDCPVGLRARVQRAGRNLARVAAAVLAAAGGWMLIGAGRLSPSMSGMEPFATLARWVRPQSMLAQRPGRQWIAGDICLPVPQAPTPTPPPANGATP